MKISDELKQRIRQLEIEQERQQKDLVDLEQLRDLAAIEEMEKELANIDQSFAKLVPAEKLNDIEVDKELETLKEGDAPVVSTPAPTVHDIDLTLEKLAAASKPKSQGKGFIILLMFDPTSPTEWSEQSGGGWRGKGQGTVYSTKSEAEAMLKQLKQKWADYPLKIVAN
ncbi:MAG: hypothetical protein RIT27_482 [Pseudomonadota bacterium]